jgi:hypothetical protein
LKPATQILRSILDERMVTLRLPLSSLNAANLGCATSGWRRTIPELITAESVRVALSRITFTTANSSISTSQDFALHAAPARAKRSRPLFRFCAAGFSADNTLKPRSAALGFFPWTWGALNENNDTHGNTMLCAGMAAIGSELHSSDQNSAR